MRLRSVAIKYIRILLFSPLLTYIHARSAWLALHLFVNHICETLFLLPYSLLYRVSILILLLF